MARTIAVLAKWPDPGQVKTRLSPALPATLACDLHRAMLADTIAAVLAARADRRLLLWAGAPSGAAPSGVPEGAGVEWASQRGPDLGARLEAAFEDFGAAGPTAVVGSDAPELAGAALDAALDALEAHDLVLGPTPDGGYYLVGLARPVPGLFEGVAWSTPRALADTEERATARGLSLATLEPLADVDTSADLVALVARLLDHPDRAAACATTLTRFGLLPPRS